MSAFCLGETLHARTTSTRSDASRNELFKFSLASITLNDAPPTIIAFLVEAFIIFLVVERHSSS